MIKELNNTGLIDHSSKAKIMFIEALNEEEGTYYLPIVEESNFFWSNLSSQKEIHEAETEWLNFLKEEKGEYQRTNFVISKRAVTN